MHIFLWSVNARTFHILPRVVKCKILSTRVYALLSYYINTDEGMRAVA